MTKIYIIRHAEAEGNIFRRMDGHYNSRITKNGQRQIAALRERFADTRIDAVYASDLLRTCETSKALYVPKGLPLHRDARFREIYLGADEDLSFGWLEHFCAERMRNFNKAPEKWYAEGAESYFEATDRFLAGLKELAEKHQGQTIAIFSHGGVTTWAMLRLYGERMHSAPRCDNTGVCLLHYENGQFDPEYFYDNSHLSEEISTLGHQKWWRGTDRFNLWFRDFTKEDAGFVDPAFPMPEGHRKRVAMRSDERVGYLSYDPKTGEISCLYLIPDCRHIRMGDQLIGEILNHCRAEGIQTLSVPFDPENKALRGLLDRHNAVFESDRATIEISLPSY